MSKTKITIEKGFEIAQVDDRLFSSFIEHLGRAIYSGIYEKDHPESDEQGFRKDVIALVKELNVPLVRYPGGNFLSAYNWKDGIGPVKDRPVRLEAAWRSIEPNLIGIDEFYDWTQKAGTKIMGAVNMGTGSVQDTAELLEYCNFPGGTYWSDLRIKNGHKNPYSIKNWCIGNEMDGSWQICHMTAADYGKKALETAKLMKLIDNEIECVVCGSSSPNQATFPEWDRIVLEHTYDTADYISLHRYYENTGSDKDFLASFLDMDRFIKSVTATCDYVKALKRSKKTMYLSFDEWNVWYHKKMTLKDWERGPEILEDRYSLLDALVIGGLGITLLKNADRVRIACLAQLVNVIAPVITQKGGKAIRQLIYWPFKDISLYGRGTVLNLNIQSPLYETKYGDTPTVTACALVSRDGQTLTLFALNTDLENEHTLELLLHSFGDVRMIKHSVLSGADINIKNTFEKPDVIMPHEVQTEKKASSSFTIKLEKASWNVIQFTA